jgi:hypothetical protein
MSSTGQAVRGTPRLVALTRRLHIDLLRVSSSVGSAA